MTRRAFLAQSSVAALVPIALPPGPFAPGPVPARRFTPNLIPSFKSADELHRVGVEALRRATGRMSA